MKKTNRAAECIDQKLYKPMMDWIIDFVKRRQFYDNNRHAIETLSMLSTLGVSYCQPELMDERCIAMLHSLGGTNLDVVEFRQILNDIKGKVSTK